MCGGFLLKQRQRNGVVVPIQRRVRCEPDGFLIRVQYFAYACVTIGFHGDGAEVGGDVVVHGGIEGGKLGGGLQFSQRALLVIEMGEKAPVRGARARMVGVFFQKCEVQFSHAVESHPDALGELVAAFWVGADKCVVFLNPFDYLGDGEVVRGENRL